MYDSDRFFLLCTTIARERGLIGSGWWLCVSKHRAKRANNEHHHVHTIPDIIQIWRTKIPKVSCYFFYLFILPKTLPTSNIMALFETQINGFIVKGKEMKKKYRVGIKPKSLDQRSQNCIIIKYFVRFSSLFCIRLRRLSCVHFSNCQCFWSILSHSKHIHR